MPEPIEWDEAAEAAAAHAAAVAGRADEARQTGAH